MYLLLSIAAGFSAVYLWGLLNRSYDVSPSLSSHLHFSIYTFPTVFLLGPRLLFYLRPRMPFTPEHVSSYLWASSTALMTSVFSLHHLHFLNCASNQACTLIRICSHSYMRASLQRTCGDSSTALMTSASPSLPICTYATESCSVLEMYYACVQRYHSHPNIVHHTRAFNHVCTLLHKARKSVKPFECGDRFEDQTATRSMCHIRESIGVASIAQGGCPNWHYGVGRCRGGTRWCGRCRITSRGRRWG